jgi:putative transposase
MRAGRDYQPLSYDLRLPDEAQADALRLLDASRAVVNALLVDLWPRLDEFRGERSGSAWKQVVAMTGSPEPHGDRQFRCEAETAGRIFRAQAERKLVFELIQPILSDGFIRPKADTRPAGKNRKTIKEAIEALQKTLETDETDFVTMQNVVEQACNYFLEHGEFPATYEQMQRTPLLTVGLLTYAGDDGGAKGQAYRFALDLDAEMASLRFRFPDEAGKWQWRKEPVEIALPECVTARLREGVPMAPTLRELVQADGNRIAVLDVVVQVKKAEQALWNTVERVLGFDWGVHGLLTAVVLGTNPTEPDKPVQLSRPLFVNTGGLDGHQARTRRQIDELKAARDTLAEDDPKRIIYEAEIACCWRLYEARNRELAHLAANLLLLFASAWGCSHCSYNADRDYCAAVNIARLGMAFLTQMQTTGKAKAFSVTDEPLVKSVRYRPTDAVLLFPPPVPVGRLLSGGKIYLNGWKKSCTIRSSYATPLILRICG